jgi:hypothetical protein
VRALLAILITVVSIGAGGTNRTFLPFLPHLPLDEHETRPSLMYDVQRVIRQTYPESKEIDVVVQLIRPVNFICRTPDTELSLALVAGVNNTDGNIGRQFATKSISDSRQFSKTVIKRRSNYIEISTPFEFSAWRMGKYVLDVARPIC